MGARIVRDDSMRLPVPIWVPRSVADLLEFDMRGTQIENGRLRARAHSAGVMCWRASHGGCSIRNAVAMSSHYAAPTQRIVRLVGVYDADSTMRGELAYWVGARLGRRHCSLCEITHSSVRQRPEWKACQVGLPVPFDTYHRNDQPEPIRTAAGGQAPVVVAETDTGHMVLLTAAELEACDGSIDRLVDAIERSAVRLGLTWAAP